MSSGYRASDDAALPDHSVRIQKHICMPQRYSLVHVSDPHLSVLFSREHARSFRSLLRFILERGFDHLVISGDIVSTGDEADFVLARETLDKHGLLDGQTLTVVPGNHDIFGGPHRAVDILSFPQHIRTRNLELFSSAFAESFQGAFRLSDRSLYPFVKVAGPLLLIGINSIPPWSLWSNPLGTNGILDDDHFEALQSLVGSPLLASRIVVAVLHHHFNNAIADDISQSLWHRIESRTMRMKGRRKVLKLFADLGVRFVLHGHIHRNEVYEREGITMANGAGAVCDDTVSFLKFNELLFSYGYASLTRHVLPIPTSRPAPRKRYSAIKRQSVELVAFPV
jgi:3',5'-cyclic AMP phosphodiesterase CpdA